MCGQDRKGNVSVKLLRYGNNLGVVTANSDGTEAGRVVASNHFYCCNSSGIQQIVLDDATWLSADIAARAVTVQ